MKQIINITYKGNIFIAGLFLVVGLLVSLFTLSPAPLFIAIVLMAIPIGIWQVLTILIMALFGWKILGELFQQYVIFYMLAVIFYFLSVFITLNTNMAEDAGITLGIIIPLILGGSHFYVSYKLKENVITTNSFLQ